MKYNLNIAIDDVNPKKGWRILGDETEKWIFDLNKKFGVKYTLFIPSNYHGENPISKSPDWIAELKDTGIFELAAHGHFHQTSNSNVYGEREFEELVDIGEIKNRIMMMKDEWNLAGHHPLGWRTPGWDLSENSLKELEVNFSYAAIHPNQSPNDWYIKTFSGANLIHENNLNIIDNNILLHSHIAGKWNMNRWDRVNYHILEYNLETINKQLEINNKFLKEL